MNNDSKKNVDSLRQRAEELINKSKDLLENITLKEVKQLFHELKVYQIELELQNDELRKTQNELENSRNSYADLFNFAPTGYVILSDIGQIIQVNKTFAEMINNDDASKFIHKNFNDFIVDEDKSEFLARYKSFFKNPVGKFIEVRIKRAQFEPITALITGRTIVGKNFNIKEKDKSLLLSVIDITERKKFEEIIQKNLLRVELAMKFANMAWWDMYLDTGFVEFHSRKAEILGYPPERFKHYKDFMELVHPEDYDKTLEAMKEHIYGNRDKYEIEYRIKAINGEYKWFYDVGFITQRDKDNKPIKISGQIIDITERKLAEEEIRRREAELSSIINSTNIYFIKTDLSGNYTFVNKKFREKFDWIYNGDDLIGKNAMESVFSEDQKKTLEVVNKCINQPGIPFSIEIRKPLKNEINFTSFWSFTCNLNNKGEPNEIVCVGIDITEKKLAEEEIKKLLTAIEQSEISIVITDKDANIQYVNPFCTKSTGYSREELLNQNPRILKSGHTSLEEYKKMWDQLTSGEAWEGTFLNKKKNGELYWEHTIITPIKNDKNEITHYIAVKDDITEDIKNEKKLQQYSEHLEELVRERTEKLDKLNIELMEQLKKEKQLEKELEVALSKEKELNELKTKFIASVSHEFRTPLASLLSSSQIIQKYAKKWDEEKLNVHYNRINSTIKYLTQMLDDVITISRADKEMISNNPKLFDIKPVMDSLIYEINTIKTEKHKIVCDLKLKKDTLFLDKKLFRQIVINLLSNAVKYSPDGGVVELKLEEEENHLNISIKDEGIGIDENEKNYIFEPFFRANNSVGIKGTGLGLNITKRCVDLLKGTIEVESKLNVGTKFTVRIPLK